MRVPCEVYSRIVGYYRPLRNGATALWNPGAMQMHADRRMYDLGKVTQDDQFPRPAPESSPRR